MTPGAGDPDPLAAAVARAEVDVAALVAEARREAEAEVRVHLRRLFVDRLTREAIAAAAGEPVEGRPLPERPIEPAVPQPPSAEGTGWYVYGIVGPATAAVMPGTAGVAGAEVTTLGAGPIHALVSEVALDDVGAVDLEHRIAEPGWLEDRVRAHDRVLHEALAAGPVIPLRFATVLPTPDDVLALLDRHARQLTATLERLDGCQEWGVKILAGPGAAASLTGAADDVDAGIVSAPGRAYLQRRTRERDAAEEARRAFDALADACHERLVAGAEAATALPVRDEDGAATVVLNAAYLVADHRLADFELAVAELHERNRIHDVTVELTGPWPPYSFVSLDLEGAER